MKPAPENMKWSETIAFPRPPQDVRLLSPTAPPDWREQMRQREEAAFQRGRQEGENALRQQLVQQRNEIAELLNGIIASLRQAVPQVVAETETAVIQLALESAGKIVASLPLSSEMVEGVIREALRQVEDTAEIIIQLHPEDLALLRQHHAAILTGVPELGPLRFVGSADATRGGCLVQTRFGLIDARRETKLEQLRQALT